MGLTTYELFIRLISLYIDAYTHILNPVLLYIVVHTVKYINNYKYSLLYRSQNNDFIRLYKFLQSKKKHQIL